MLVELIVVSLLLVVIAIKNVFMVRKMGKYTWPNCIYAIYIEPTIN